MRLSTWRQVPDSYINDKEILEAESDRDDLVRVTTHTL